MYISFWNTARWFMLLIWAVKATCVQRRVDTSQDFRWSQGPCVPDTAVRKSFCFPSKQDCYCSGNGEYSNPCLFFKSLVLCLCTRSGIVCDGDRDCFGALSYIWSPKCSERNFVGASAQKGVWGSRSTDLESSSHLPPVPTSKDKENIVIALLRFEFEGTSWCRCIFF